MLYTLFAVLLLFVVALKYLQTNGERCPQCQTSREDAEYPLCPDCGWIYEVPGEEDEDYDEGYEEGYEEEYEDDGEFEDEEPQDESSGDKSKK